jgi:hypothetical protein
MMLMLILMMMMMMKKTTQADRAALDSPTCLVIQVLTLYSDAHASCKADRAAGGIQLV